MFKETNPTIDLKVVGERASLELARIQRAKDRERAYTTVGAVKAEFSGDQTDPNLPPERLTLAQKIARKLAGWTWCFYHLPAIWRTASAAQTHAIGAQEEARAARSEAREAAQVLKTLRKDLDELSSQRNNDLEGLSSQIAALRREIMFQQRRLTRLAELDRLPKGAERAEKTIAGADQRLDALYLAFEDAFRGTREHIKLQSRPVPRSIITGRSWSKEQTDSRCRLRPRRMAGNSEGSRPRCIWGQLQFDDGGVLHRTGS